MFNSRFTIDVICTSLTITYNKAPNEQILFAKFDQNFVSFKTLKKQQTKKELGSLQKATIKLRNSQKLKKLQIKIFKNIKLLNNIKTRAKNELQTLFQLSKFKNLQTRKTQLASVQVFKMRPLKYKFCIVVKLGIIVVTKSCLPWIPRFVVMVRR